LSVRVSHQEQPSGSRPLTWLCPPDAVPSWTIHTLAGDELRLSKVTKGPWMIAAWQQASWP